MKKSIAVLFLGVVVFCATSAGAALDHKPFKGMKVPECSQCHFDEKVVPNHQAGWNIDHRRFSVKTDKATTCVDCHDQAFCAECHYGGGIDAGLNVPNPKETSSVMPKSHRSDFRELHPIAASQGPSSCERCHPVNFCTECHSKFQPADLAFLSHRKGWSDRPATDGGPKHSTFALNSCRNCHPSAALPKREWTGDHKREARRNLQACQSCHPDGDICLKCHSARSGLKVKPHPDDFGRIKGRLERAAGNRTCVKCH